MSKFYTEDIDVAILCGGMGKRLQSVVADRPKPMALINGRPFLDKLIEHVSEFGFKRFILCVGYKSEKIIHYYQKKRKETIVFSIENKPLGTGGAFAQACSLIKSPVFLGMNGDSFCPINLEKFLEFHCLRKADLSIALTHMDESRGFGTITLDTENKVISFKEKADYNSAALVNTGNYLIKTSLLRQVSTAEPFSLEFDFFPNIINKQVYGYVTHNKLFDIGTPERYKKAKQFFSKINRKPQ